MSWEEWSGRAALYDSTQQADTLLSMMSLPSSRLHRSHWYRAIASIATRSLPLLGATM